MTPRCHAVTDVADLLGTSKRHVYNLIADGHLPVVNLSHAGRPKLRVTDDALQAYIASRTYRPSGRGEVTRCLTTTVPPAARTGQHADRGTPPPATSRPSTARSAAPAARNNRNT